MKKILVVDDDEHLRTAVCTILKENNYNVTRAPDGRRAREILLDQEFDLIISDIQMPQFTGIELLEWIRARSDVSVLLITGFTSLLETLSAHDKGANKFLLKPFKGQELLEAVQSALSKQGNGSPDQHQVFYKVSISEFVSRSQIDFDVFVKLSKEKYIQIGRSGDELPKEQIQKYKNNGIKHFYIRKKTIQS